MDRGNPMMGLPQTGKPKKKPPAQLTDFGQVVKIMMFVFNVIFLLTGMMILGVGIWIAVDRNFMAHITGTVLFSASLFILISAGCLIIILSFLGCCGAVTENRTMLGAFLVALAVIFAILLTAGIIAFVFRGQLHEAIRQHMMDTINKYYGVDLYEEYNRQVTWSWDQTQERLHCCAVDDSGWQIYRSSEWYKQQPGIPGTTKPYVPPSCCRRDFYHNVLDLTLCQTWRQGPPGMNTGAHNGALNYRGCYNAGKNWLFFKSSFLIGFGLAVAFFLIFGMLCSAYLLKALGNEKK